MRIGSVNLYRDEVIRPYPEHYQRGAGILPAFSGTVYQEGNGLGDILRSVFRLVLPIVSSGASTFLKSAAQGISEGKSLGDAAKGSLAPMAKKVVGKAVKRVVQSGSGRKRGRRRRRRNRKGQGQTGGSSGWRKSRRKHHSKNRVKRVYKHKKRTGLKRKRVSSSSFPKKRFSKRRKITIFPSNF